MSEVRAAIRGLIALGWNDERILAHIVNRPTTEQLDELRAHVITTNPGRTGQPMVHYARHHLEELRKEYISCP